MATIHSTDAKFNSIYTQLRELARQDNVDTDTDAQEVLDIASSLFQLQCRWMRKARTELGL